MSETESIFLANAKKLDEALASISERLKSDEISDQNTSQLTYVLNERQLSWTHRLIQDKTVAPEIFRIAVKLEYFEPMDATETSRLELVVSSEIFQKGASSRVSKSSTESKIIDEQLLNDFEATVFAMFEKGWELLKPYQ